MTNLNQYSYIKCSPIKFVIEETVNAIRGTERILVYTTVGTHHLVSHTDTWTHVSHEPHCEQNSSLFPHCLKKVTFRNLSSENYTVRYTQNPTQPLEQNQKGQIIYSFRSPHFLRDPDQRSISLLWYFTFWPIKEQNSKLEMRQASSRAWMCRPFSCL